MQENAEQFLGNSFIILWLNKVESPTSLYDVVKDRLYRRHRKDPDRVFLEEDF